MYELAKRLACACCPPLTRLQGNADRLTTDCILMIQRCEDLHRRYVPPKPMPPTLQILNAEKRPDSLQTPIAVLYLARKAEGMKAFREFMGGYRRFSAGAEHDLVVMYKGFNGPADPALTESREFFAQTPHAAVLLSDVGFDLGGYAMTARRIPSPYVCCLNTYSEPLADDWLGKLYRYAKRPEVGVAGASCSYESITTSRTILSKATYYYSQFPEHRAATRYYFGDLLNLVAPQPGKWKALQQWLGSFATSKSRRRHAAPAMDWDAWMADWISTSPGLSEQLELFPRFPNPHMRSNAMVLKRTRLMRWLHRIPVTKFECALLESGHDSLTQQVLRDGKTVLIVGRDGKGYPVEHFSESQTFRSGCQENLLVADNRTREFLAMSPGYRALSMRMSWGDYLAPEPPDFPALGEPIAKDPSLETVRRGCGEPRAAFENSSAGAKLCACCGS